MRIAFLGHSYHRKTGSSGFFLDLLERQAGVERFWDEAWHGGDPLDVDAIARGGFDAIVVWQLEVAASRLARSGHPNVTFVPMYDGCHALPDSYWLELGAIKVLCFCTALWERLGRLGLRVRRVQFFPEPAPVERGDASTAPRGYFWQRQQDITWRTVRQILGESRFSGFTLCQALDPTYGAFVAPADEEVARYSIGFSGWHGDRRAALAHLAAHDVYFAPRLREGIGMSFLEAMASGAAVVAADRPTMNEYVVHGVNGLLYDPDHPRPLDFTSHRALGRRALRTVEVGRAKWLRSTPGMIRFVLEPTAAHPAKAPFDALDPWALDGTAPAPRRGVRVPGGALVGGRRAEGVVPAAPGALPRVTVAVVTRNAADTLGPTLETVLAQDWPNREIVVLDGASTDGTVDVLGAYDEAIDHWRSAPDGGPYDAMNAAAREASGDYVIFMNAGDGFLARDSLARALDAAPAGADLIVGHHVYRHVEGYEELHRAAPFEETWRRLREGDVGWGWLSGVPGHQAALTRTSLLRANPFRTRFRYAADHDLLYRLAAAGARFHHCGAVLSTYVGGGLSWQNQGRCFEEWREIAMEHTARPDAVAARFEAMRADLRRDQLARAGLRELVARSARDADARAALLRRLRGALSVWNRRNRDRLHERHTIELGGADLGRLVRRSEGLSAPEGWGRWTDGPRALLELDPSIARPVRVRIRLSQAFGPNVGKTLVARVGGAEHRHVLAAGEQVVSVRIPRRSRAPLARIELELPAPASPRELGWGEESRRLGVAIRRIDIKGARW